MPDQNVTVIARIRAKSGMESRLRQMLEGLLAPTRAEAGCINYDLHSSTTDTREFLFHENWASAAHLDAHFKTPHLQALMAALPGIVDGQPDITTWTKLR
jgi:quinol monooxygenase YgiN